MKVIFEIETNGATHDFGGNPIQAMNEFDLELDDPLADIHSSLEKLPMFCKRILVSEEEMAKLLASSSLKQHVQTMTGDEDASVRLRERQLGVLSKGSFAPIPGLPEIMVFR